MKKREDTYKEFVVMDSIPFDRRILGEERTFILVVEAKRSTLAGAIRQFLLALNIMWDINGKNGTVYGFAIKLLDNNI